MQLLGAVLMALPFIVFAVVVVRIDGWRALAFAAGMTVAVVVPIMAGSYLLGGGHL